MATVWAAGAIVALLVVGALLYALGAAVLVRHRATGAADLAALAAAGGVTAGEAAACARARWVTDRMAVRLLTCRFDQVDALVEVEAALPGLLAGFTGPVARARAGPAAHG